MPSNPTTKHFQYFYFLFIYFDFKTSKVTLKEVGTQQLQLFCQYHHGQQQQQQELEYRILGNNGRGKKWDPRKSGVINFGGPD